MEVRLDSALAEIKALIIGMTIQHNDLRSQMGSRENGNQSGSILGNPVIAGAEGGVAGSIHNSRYGTKLEFSRFGGEGIDDWIFKVEQFFTLDTILETFKINVIALHLDGGALHWYKNFIKTRGRHVEWPEYKKAIKCRFGPLAYMIQ